MSSCGHYGFSATTRSIGLLRQESAAIASSGTEADTLLEPASAMRGEPLVSVCIRTYNQAEYLVEALTSALDQVTNFEYEIVIGDDCSTDNTVDVLAQWRRRNPSRIRVIRHAENLGYRLNLVETVSHCKGRYVAMLDADDYWIDDGKLQAQVDFLEAHPNVAACGNRYVTLRQVDGHLKETLSRKQRQIADAQRFYRGFWLKHSTMMYRRQCLTNIPDWIFECHSEDIALQAISIQRGPLGFINKPMTAYRDYEQGVFSALDTIEKIEWSISSWETIAGNLGEEARAESAPRIALQCFELADLYLEEGNDERSKEWKKKGARYGSDSLLRKIKRRSRHTSLYRILVNARRNLFTH